MSPALNFKVKVSENEVGHSVQVVKFGKYNNDNNKLQIIKNKGIKQRNARKDFILKYHIPALTKKDKTHIHTGEKIVSV